MTSQVPGAEQRMAAGPGKALEMMGEAGQKIAQTIERASLLQEVTKAENFLDERLRDIQNRASQDPDVSDANMQKYMEEADSAVHDSGDIITIPFERGLFNQKSSSRASISKTSIQNHFLKQKISLGKEQLDIYTNNRMNDFIEAKNSMEKERAVLERDLKIKESVEAGYLTAGDAVKMKDSMDKEWAKAQVEYDIATNPEMAEELLKKKIYPDIPEKERVNLLSKATAAKQKQIKDAETEMQFKQIENEAELMTNVAIGEMDLSSVPAITKMIGDQTIRPELGEAAIRAIMTPINKFDMKEDDTAFVNMIESVFRADDPKKINDVMKDVLNGYSNNKIHSRTMALLAQTAKRIGEPKQEAKKRQELERSHYERVTQYADENGLDRAAMAKTYASNLVKDVSPQEAADIAIEDGIIKVDPTYSRRDESKKNEGPVKMVPEGQIIINLKTGERMQMVNGRWITIN